MKTILHITCGFIAGATLIAGAFTLLSEKTILQNTSNTQFVTDESKELSTIITPVSNNRLEFTTIKDNNPFLLEKRTYIYTGKEGSYVDGASGSLVTGKILFDVKNNKNITVPRRSLLGENFWSWTIPEGKKYEITAIYGDIPGDGDIISRENIYIVTDIKEI
jgi:hypothetical protein